MTGGGCVIAGLFLLSLRAKRGNLGGARDCFVVTTPRNDRRGMCHCEQSVAISGKQNSKIKGQNDRAKMKKTVSIKLKADS